MFSIILTHKKDGGIRDRHAQYTIARYQKMFRTAEIIVAECDDDKQGWKTFNKAKHINEAVKNAKHSRLLITDIDMIFHKKAILDGLKALPKHCYVVPYNTRLFLEQQDTEKILNGELDIDSFPWYSQDASSYRKDKDTPICGGCHIINTDDFKLVDGYDEKFVGWGAEDRDFGGRVRGKCNGETFHVNYYGYHLWHPMNH